MEKKHIIKNILLATIWLAIGAGTIVLLVAAIQKKEASECTGVDINIKGVSNNFFVDKNDILHTIITISGETPVGRPVGALDLNNIESALQKNKWIKTAQLFFDNNERLQVNVIEREPVARVFTTSGATFYIDSSITMLPVSEKFSARLPVFTGFPSDKRVLLKADSNLLNGILDISLAIQQDSFDMAMIEQVDITPQRSFELVPKFGNTIITFGDAKNALEKLAKLRLFYKEIVIKAGWNKYSEINIQYHNQVVGKRKGANEVKADSLKALQLMKVIAANAELLAADSLQAIIPDNEQNSTNKNIIQQSIERDDNNTGGGTTAIPGAPAEVFTETTVPLIVEQTGTPEPSSINPAKASGTNNTPAAIKRPAAKAKPTKKPKPGQIKKPQILMPKPLPEKPVAKPNEY